MLTRWADELVATSEFPANQLCTDDFTGPLANNTNLGVSALSITDQSLPTARLWPLELLADVKAARSG